MAQPKDFKFYFRSENGANYDYYSIVNGVFTTTTSATPVNELQYSPKDWDKIQLIYSRGFDTKGIFINVSDNFKFVGDGAHILRKKHFEGGVNAKLEFLILKFNRSGSVYSYELFDSGICDFQTAINEDTFFSIKIAGSKFLSKYETRKSTKYSIPITNNANAKWVYFDGINLQCIFNWVAIGAGGANPANNFDEYPFFGFASTEGTNLSTLTYDIDAPSGNTSLFQNDSSSAIDYRIQYNGSIITLKTSGASSFAHIIVRLKDSAGVYISGFTPLFISGSLAIGVSNVIPFNIDETINVPAGHFLEISVIMRDAVYPSGSAFDNSLWNITGGNSNLKISLANKTKEGYIPTLERKVVFEELVKLIGDNTTTAVSTYLESEELADKWMFSGDSARNLENANLYISLDDFFATIDAVHGASLHYDKANDELILGSISDVFVNSEIVDIGEVAKCTVKPLTSELYGKLLIGQQDYTYDEVNGKDEFNTEIELLSPLEGIKESKSFLSPARHDVNGIEQTRENLSEKKVTDAESDNDIFEIHVDPIYDGGIIPAGYQNAGGEYYDIYRDNTLIIDNIYSPETMYNIFFSPKRCLLRRGAWNRSLLFGNDTEYIKFIRSKKSNELGLYMVTDDGTTIIDEGANVLISTLNDPIFKPFLLDIETATNENIMALINATPFGFITFKYKGLEYTGFVIELTRQALVNEKTNLTLLATNGCDLTQFIN